MCAMQSELGSFESVSRSRHVLLKVVSLYVVLFVVWLLMLDVLAFSLAWSVSNWLMASGTLALVTEAVFYRLR
jgi:hypothetical protein